MQATDRVNIPMTCTKCKAAWIETYPKDHFIHGTCPNCGHKNVKDK